MAKKKESPHSSPSWSHCFTPSLYFVSQFHSSPFGRAVWLLSLYSMSRCWMSSPRNLGLTAFAPLLIFYVSLFHSSPFGLIVSLLRFILSHCFTPLPLVSQFHSFALRVSLFHSFALFCFTVSLLSLWSSSFTPLLYSLCCWAYSPIICLKIPLPLFDLASIVFLPWWISSLLFTKSMESWVMVECWSIRKFVEWFDLL